MRASVEQRVATVSACCLTDTWLVINAISVLNSFHEAERLFVSCWHSFSVSENSEAMLYIFVFRFHRRFVRLFAVTSFVNHTCTLIGRDSSVGIATLYGLDGLGIESH